MQFTEKFVQALKPKGERYDIREKSGDGFAIRVSPSGEKSWVFFYFFDGKKRRMTLGKYPAMSLAAARAKHRDALKMLEADKDPALERHQQRLDSRLSSTVEALIEEYIEKWAKPRKRSWNEDKRILDKDVKPAWGKRKAKDISKREVILLLESIEKRGAPIAANRTLACVRRMFNFAVERDIIGTSPCTSIKAPAKENRRDRCLSVNEIHTFWHGLEKAAMSEKTKLVLKLQFVTAQRKGEIITAAWSEIDLETGWWTIPDTKAKNNHPHRVPLSNLAIQLLKKIKVLSGDSDWLFPSDQNADKHIRGESVDRAVRRSDEKAFDGINHFTPHDLRRTAATYMTEMGISRIVVSKLLNHADSGITAIYDRHSYDPEKRHALAAWGKKLEQIINNIESVSNVVTLNAGGRI